MNCNICEFKLPTVIFANVTVMSVEHAGTGHRCSLCLQSDYFSSGYQKSTILPIQKLGFLPKYEIYM